jgi:hypothetical protein
MYVKVVPTNEVVDAPEIDTPSCTSPGPRAGDTHSIFVELVESVHHCDKRVIEALPTAP